MAIRGGTQQMPYGGGGRRRNENISNFIHTHTHISNESTLILLSEWLYVYIYTRTNTYIIRGEVRSTYRPSSGSTGASSITRCGRGAIIIVLYDFFVY